MSLYYAYLSSKPCRSNDGKLIYLVSSDSIQLTIDELQSQVESTEVIVKLSYGPCTD